MTKTELAFAVFVLTVALVGCQSASSPANNPTPARATAGETPSPAAVEATSSVSIIKLEGKAREEFDSIVRTAGAAGSARLLKNTLDVLLEDQPRSKRPTKSNSTLEEGFAGRDMVKGARNDCTVAAYSDHSPTTFESSGNGSNTKVTSSLTGAYAKVYCDLKLHRSDVLIPKNSVLYREDSRWVSVKATAEVERQFEAIK